MLQQLLQSHNATKKIDAVREITKVVHPLLALPHFCFRRIHEFRILLRMNKNPTFGVKLFHFETVFLAYLVIFGWTVGWLMIMTECLNWLNVRFRTFLYADALRRNHLLFQFPLLWNVFPTASQLQQVKKRGKRMVSNTPNETIKWRAKSDEKTNGFKKSPTTCLQ